MVRADRDEWLGRFANRAVIRERGAFWMYSATDRPNDTPRVVVVPAPVVDPEQARTALGRLAAAHSRIEHPLVARVAETDLDGPTPFVSFACAATLDLDEVLRLGRDFPEKVRHARADGFIRDLRIALQHAHSTTDPETGRPICIGSLGYGNVLFAVDGSYWLIGLGHNIVTRDASGREAEGATVFQAPEVAVGSPPEPSSDFVALMLFMRSMIHIVALERAVIRTLAGNTLREDLELAKSILWFERCVVAAPVTRRASLAEAVRVSNRIRELLGVVPDPAGFRAHVAAVIDQATRSSGRAARGLIVDHEARTFRDPGGTLHQIGSRPSVRRILRALVDTRIHTPGDALTVQQLFEAGWPGDRALVEASSNRVYVAIAYLRACGLRDAIQRHDSGYRLDPSLGVEYGTTPGEVRRSP